MITQFLNFIAQVREFVKFFLSYLLTRLYQFGLFFEEIKNILIAILVVKRGKYSITFLNTVFFMIVLTVYFLSPVIAENNPFKQTDETISRDLLSFEYNPQENSVITDISVKPRPSVVKYVVREGDTLSSIAKKFNIDVNSIKWANDLKTDSIKVGQELDIPPGIGIVHTVKKGETIYTIAKKYKVDAQNIVNFPFNEYLDDDSFTLAVGQTIFVPGGVIETAPQPIYIAGSNNQTEIQGGQPGSGSFIWPTSGRITQYPVAYHMALDIANRSAPAIFSADSGVVIYAGCVGYGYGCHIIIDHQNGYRTLYAHLSRIYVNVGNSVNKGATIGQMGSTGRSTGTHLHFEIIRGGVRINPLSVLR
ncbi:MAG: hypothetical protein KatS3mg090_0635 [Patescibacteria group bacterium]|nr:MAG: hypothetical protein KatS3mg090_0635 [Patescibacteria group bacterium]